MGINKNKLRMENEKLPKVLKLKDVEDDQKNRPKEMTWLIDNLVDKDYAKVNKVDILKDKKMLIILYTADFCGGAKHFVENLKTYMNGGSEEAKKIVVINVTTVRERDSLEAFKAGVLSECVNYAFAFDCPTEPVRYVSPPAHYPTPCLFNLSTGLHINEEAKNTWEALQNFEE